MSTLFLGGRKTPPLPSGRRHSDFPPFSMVIIYQGVHAVQVVGFCMQKFTPASCLMRGAGLMFFLLGLNPGIDILVEDLFECPSTAIQKKDSQERGKGQDEDFDEFEKHFELLLLAGLEMTGFHDLLTSVLYHIDSKSQMIPKNTVIHIL